MFVREKTSSYCATAKFFSSSLASLLFICHAPVIELSAEIATLQTAVLNTREELKRGMKNKQILQDEASAAQLDKEADWTHQ